MGGRGSLPLSLSSFQNCDLTSGLSFCPSLVRRNPKPSGDCLQVKGYTLANLSLHSLSFKGRYPFLGTPVHGHSSVLPNDIFFFCTILKTAIWISVLVFETGYTNAQQVGATPEDGGEQLSIHSAKSSL